MKHVVLWNLWGRPMLEPQVFETRADADRHAARSELHDDGFRHVVVEMPEDYFSEAFDVGEQDVPSRR